MVIFLTQKQGGEGFFIKGKGPNGESSAIKRIAGRKKISLCDFRSSGKDRCMPGTKSQTPRQLHNHCANHSPTSFTV